MSYFEFRTNSMYVQGEGILQEIKRYLYPYGKKYLFILACGSLSERVEETIRRSFDSPAESNLIISENPRLNMSALAAAKKIDAEHKSVFYTILDYEGKQVTYERIDEIAAFANSGGYDVLIGVGGGKALDLVRGAYHKTGANVVLIPTSSTTNAAATSISVVYSEDGSEVQDMLVMPASPPLVMADTSLLITAPPSGLAAGIGDCIATYYESILTMRENAREKHLPAITAMVHHSAKEIFFQYGYLALKSLEARTITPAFESVTAEILHIPGPMSAGISMNLAHALDEVLVTLEPCRNIPHGLLVGYGVIPTLLYGGFPISELYEYVDLAISLGIPVDLAQLGIPDVTAEELAQGVEKAYNGPSIKLCSGKFTKEQLIRYVFLADSVVNEYLEHKRLCECSSRE